MKWLYLITCLIVSNSLWGMLPRYVEKIEFSELPEELKQENSRELYVPQGLNNNYAPKDCQTAFYAKHFFNSDHLLQKQADEIEKHIENCRSFLFSQSSFNVLPLLRLGAIRHPVVRPPFLRWIKVHYSDGRIVSGVLGVKDNKPRPLIIANCGFNCDANGGPASSMLTMHLFEESEFNLSILSSGTGNEFVKDNHSISLGGVDEGVNLYALAHHFSTTEHNFSSLIRISDIHIVGQSLGAHGALYSSLYSSLNDDPYNPAISSVVAICPVVNLEPSINRLTEDGFVIRFFSKYTIQNFVSVSDFVPWLKSILTKEKNSPKALSKIADHIFDHYVKSNKFENWDLAPFNRPQLPDIETIWEYNKFKNYAPNISIPTLLIPAHNDPIVLSEENAESIRNTNPDSLAVLKIPYGSHCALNEAMGWKHFSHLIRNFISSQSINTYKAPSQKIDLYGEILSKKNWFTQLYMRKDDRVIGHNWETYTNKDYASLYLHIHRPNQRYKYCHFDPKYIDENCVEKYHVRVPLDLFDSKSVSVPKDKTEKHILRRWLNVNTYLLDESDQFLPFNKGYPSKILVSN